jgi:hypothetical protein
MTAEYTNLSPYYSTEKFGRFLDILKYRTIPKSNLDVQYIIDTTYRYRPDLLANDLYGRSQLWWVFAARNPNVIRDPIFDFEIGRTIYIPTIDTISAALGI